MHPLFRSGKKTLLTGLLWSPVTFWVIMLHMLLTGSVLRDSSIFVIPPMIIELFISASLWYICKSTPFSEAGVSTFFTKHILSMATLTGMLLIITYGYSQLLTNIFDNEKWSQLFSKSLLLFSGVSISIYILASLFYYLIISNEKVLTVEKNFLNQQLETARAELNALKSTIHPHFIFNSLNLMKPLIKKDPKRASELIAQLSEFLIYSYMYGNKSESTVEKEIEHVKNYLNVEKMRLGKRLEIEYNIDKKSFSVPILPLSLLPLAENCIKHGISQILEGGKIEINTKAKKELLIIEFKNPFEESSAIKDPRSGHGLKNLEKRVKLFYGNRAGILQESNPGVFRIRLYIPLKNGEKK